VPEEGEHLRPIVFAVVDVSVFLGFISAATKYLLVSYPLIATTTKGRWISFGTKISTDMLESGKIFPTVQISKYCNKISNISM
jgi:hypothetical protein